MQSDYSELVDWLSEHIETEDELCAFGGDGFGGNNIFRLAATAITTLKAELAEARQASDTALAMAMQAGADAERGRIVDWLRGRFQQQRQHPEDQACAQFIAAAIEARDWSRPN